MYNFTRYGWKRVGRRGYTGPVLSMKWNTSQAPWKVVAPRTPLMRPEEPRRVGEEGCRGLVLSIHNEAAGVIDLLSLCTWASRCPRMTELTSPGFLFTLGWQQRPEAVCEEEGFHED